MIKIKNRETGEIIKTSVSQSITTGGVFLHSTEEDFETINLFKAKYVLMEGSIDNRQTVIPLRDIPPYTRGVQELVHINRMSDGRFNIHRATQAGDAGYKVYQNLKMLGRDFEFVS